MPGSIHKVNGDDSPANKMNLRKIPISRILPSSRNPRGSNIREGPYKINQLRDSIAKFGILVPLVVLVEGDSYRLIDGERRYWAAMSLHGITEVPAYVAEEDLDEKDLLIRMFQIHHNLLPWGPIPQCEALEPTYQRIKRRKAVTDLTNQEAQVRAIAAALENETGIESRTAIDRVLFLRWPKKIKEALYESHENFSYIVEIEKNIILPIFKNYSEYFEQVPVNEVRQFLYDKLTTNAVYKPEEVRVVGPVVKFQAHEKTIRRKVLKIIEDLVQDKTMTYQEARDEFEREVPEATIRSTLSPRRLLTALSALREDIDNFDETKLESARGKSRARSQDIITAIDALASSLEELRGILE